MLHTTAIESELLDLISGIDELKALYLDTRNGCERQAIEHGLLKVAQRATYLSHVGSLSIENNDADLERYQRITPKLHELSRRVVHG